MVKLSVISSKYFDNQVLFLDEIQKENADVIVTGVKRGADFLLYEYALNQNIPSQVILPDYKTHGFSANYFRNLQIIEQSSKIIVFWDLINKSPLNYLKWVKKKKIPFRTVIY